MTVIVAKHGHTIIERNRLRRRLRELTRTEIIPLLSNIDVVIRSLSSAYDAPFGVLAGEAVEIARELVSGMRKQ